MFVHIWINRMLLLQIWENLYCYYSTDLQLSLSISYLITSDVSYSEVDTEIMKLNAEMKTFLRPLRFFLECSNKKDVN